MNNPEYLGDGVYIQITGYGYVLRANDHRPSHCTDEIYIEPSVGASLANHLAAFAALPQEQKIQLINNPTL